MSQHIIEVKSPTLGAVEVAAGFDPCLQEAFLNFHTDQASYISPPGTAASELQDIAFEELGVHLPEQVLAGVQEDIADLRMGATDVGRRMRRYHPDGTLAQAVTY